MNLFKRTTLTVALLIIMLSSALVYAKITHTLLVIDSESQQEFPGRFRTTSDALPVDTTYSKEGLENVRAAGSQQFSTNGLRAVLAKLPSKSVIVVDLRRESHGHMNDSAVSWFGPQNAANETKTPDQIKQSESRLLARLKKSRFKWIYRIIEKSDDGYIEKVSKEFMHVTSVKSEQQLAEEFHAGYKRFYVEDFHAPDDATIARFVNLVKHLPQDTWLYFHCRAGRGRTTTFMTMYDMMRNAKTVSFEDIMNRQMALGGSNLQELPEENHYKYKYALQRLNFLKNFYEYIKTNNDDFSTTWLQWKRNIPVKSS